MVFSRTGVPELLENVLYNGVRITQVFFCKYLGFYIDCILSWKKHGEIVSAKSARGLGVMRRLKKVFPVAVVKLLYSAIVHRITYCSQEHRCQHLR